MDKQELYDLVEQEGGIRPASRACGIPESTIRARLKNFMPGVPDHGFVPEELELPATHIGEDGVDTLDMSSKQRKFFILTSAQNNCPVHEGFLRNLQALEGHLPDAQLLVSFSVYDRTGYRGLTTKGEKRTGKHQVWWDKAVQPYAVNSRVRLAKRLAFCGELDILATTQNPLSGFDSYCGRSSLIVPHNRFAFRCVESRPHQMPKELFTTGSVTTRRFIQRKTGQLAHFHHVIGAILVEVTEDGYWYAHHLNAEEDGSFYWLDKRVEGGKVRKNKDGIAALVLGDIHHEKIDPDAADITLGAVKALKPKHVLVHDLIDFTSRNHHNRNDPLFKVSMHQLGTSVAEEVEGAGDFLKDVHERVPKAEIAVVRSNHDGALDRWIKETDWRADPLNAQFHLECALEMVKARVNGRRFNPLAWAIHKSYNPNSVGSGYKLPPWLRFLGLDESYEVKGVECGIHGHVGPSGSRGNPRGFSRLGFKTFTAHTHSPSIVDGCYTVGVTGKLNMGYNVGPSKWMHCHGIVYPNGKRAFIFIKNGKAGLP